MCDGARWYFCPLAGSYGTFGNLQGVSIGLAAKSTSYEQNDQTKREEQGELKNTGTDDEFVAVKGSYSWVGPDGLLYTVNYVADENGFQPSINQPPGGAIPPGVVTSLLG